MRTVFVALSGLLLGCAATTPAPRSAPSSPAPAPAPAAAAAVAPAPIRGADLDGWKKRPADAACRAALATLVSGTLDGFHGLGRCGRVDAEGTLGDSGRGPSQFEQMGEYRVFSRPGGNVLAWFLGDDIRVVELLYPKLARPLAQELGAPEKKIASRLSPEWDQWIYASRGLTAHVNRATGEVVALFAYRATTVEAFLESDIARVAKSEAPLEELK